MNEKVTYEKKVVEITDFKISEAITYILSGDSVAYFEEVE